MKPESIGTYPSDAPVPEPANNQVWRRTVGVVPSMAGSLFAARGHSDRNPSELREVVRRPHHMETFDDAPIQLDPFGSREPADVEHG